VKACLSCAIALARPGNLCERASTACHWLEPRSLLTETNASAPERTSVAPEGVAPPPLLLPPPPPPQPAASTARTASRASARLRGLRIVILSSVDDPSSLQLTRSNRFRQGLYTRPR